ncbi:MAG TPA: flagellar FliJ family protein [Microbacteriaceae bacterium]|nr:flagellar FliJ family protein [Microbacteriaceae bacterium]
MATFHLSGLLRLRTLRESLAAVGLAEARHELSGVRDRRARVGAQLAGTTVAATGPESLAAIAAARASAQAMIGSLAALEELAGQKAEAAAAAHRLARTEARTIRRLSDRFAAEEARKDLHREQVALDEIAITRWGRAAHDGPGQAS